MQISPRALARELLTNLNPRELFYWVVGSGVYWTFRLSMRVELYGMREHFCPPAPATLVIGAHKRDSDPILLAAFCHWPRGWLAPDARRMAFAGRSDMLEPGFLATVVGYKGWPRWIQYLLDHTSFAPIAHLMRGYPILRIPEYTLRQYLRRVLKEEGDLPLGQVLSERTLALFLQGQQSGAGRTAGFLTGRSRAGHLYRRLPAGRGGEERSAGEDTDRSRAGHLYRRLPAGRSEEKRATERQSALTVSKVLGWAYRPLTNRSIRAHMLAPGRYERLREAWRAQVAEEMETLAHVMNNGDPLWFAPEGAVSLDGRLLRLRSGLHTLLSHARPDVRCLPVNFTYDFMTSEHRMIACVGIGPTLEGLPGLEQTELAARVAPAIVRQTVVTMSQLGSARLMDHLAAQRLHFAPEEELPILDAQVRRLADLGAIIQRDLRTRRGLRRRLSAFLGYCQKHRLLFPDKNGGYVIAAEAITGTRSSTFWENPVRYSANELRALEEVLQPTITPANDARAAAPQQDALLQSARPGEAEPAVDGREL
jgi:hypothetical protein